MSAPIHDPVGDDAPGAREIGFACPANHNASDVLFANLAAGRGDRVALRTPSGTMTYAALCARANRVAAALTAAGLAWGERVACLLDDTPDYAAVIFGAMRAGFVPVLLNTASPADGVRFYVEDSGAGVAFVEAGLAATLGAGPFAGAGVRRLVIVGEGALPEGGEGFEASSFETLSFEDFLGEAPESFDPPPTHRDEMAFWMYSSGSTGKPKGVVHLHHDMAYTAASYAAHVLALTADDVCFSVPKIFFAYGFGNTLTFPFAVGASSVLLPGRPEAGRVFEAIAWGRPTVLFGLPTLYTALVKDPALASADLSSLRLCVSAAEVLAAEVFGAWRARSGHEIVEGLGSTELLHIYLSNTGTSKRLGAAGLRVPGYELRLVTAEGRDAADFEEGVLLVRGHSSAPLYWNRPDKTADTMREGGWLWTGDKFLRDADGFHFFQGRADDLIKVSGQWVYPLEVELCLADHPDVRECAVLGIELPDRRMTLRAFVTLDRDAAPDEATRRGLQDYVKQRLVPYKYPREVAFLPELPKTGTGKIDRQALRLTPLDAA